MRKFKAGFSLPEIMVVLTIVGIAMAIGVPSIQDWLANQRLRSAAYNVVISTMTARTEAKNRGTDVAMKAPASNDLTGGWCVQLGATADCSIEDPGVATLAVQQPTTGVTFAFVGSAAAPIIFNASGRLTGLIKLEISDDVLEDLKRCVFIDSGANARTEIGACPT